MTRRDLHINDFTEKSYRELVRLAAAKYEFARFHELPEGPHVLWRHDLDFSVHRAARLAEIEAAEGVRATYFVALHSFFYNALENEVADRIRMIVELGHDLALHYHSDFYPRAGRDQLEEVVRREARFLSETFEVPVRAFSFHNPDVDGDLALDEETLGGLVNVYARSFRDGYDYVSDSNGYWRFRRLRDVLEDAAAPRVHVLTHPGWWQRDPMLPRERIVRCIEGRAAANMALYDGMLDDFGRENIG